MTHGDKAKAKTGKSSSQTSGKKVSKAAESKAGGKDVKGGSKAVQAGKGDSKASAKLAAEKDAASKKSSASAKESAAAAADARAKVRVPSSDGSGFSNSVVGSAFKHALKKYPNAFRKLTD